MKRAVKYCGGCNPRFDRVALVRRLEEKLGERLPAAQPGVHYDELYIVCGCSARCADISGLSAKACFILDHEAARQEQCPVQCGSDSVLV